MDDSREMILAAGRTQRETPSNKKVYPLENSFLGVLIDFSRVISRLVVGERGGMLPNTVISLERDTNI